MSNINTWMVVIAWGVSIFLAFIIGSRKGKPVAGDLAGIMLSPIRVIVNVATL